MDPMNDLNPDDAIDAEVRRAMDVEPSSQFLARVRVRIAEEEAPAWWSFRWIFSVAAVASAVYAVRTVAGI